MPFLPTRRPSDLIIMRATTDSNPAVDFETAGSGVLNLTRSEEHTSELQSLRHLVFRLLLGKKHQGRRGFQDNEVVSADLRENPLFTEHPQDNNRPEQGVMDSIQRLIQFFLYQSVPRKNFHSSP